MQSHLTHRKISLYDWHGNRCSISQTEVATCGSPFCRPSSMTWTFPELLSYSIKVNPKLPRSNTLLFGCFIMETPQYFRYLFGHSLYQRFRGFAGCNVFEKVDPLASGGQKGNKIWRDRVILPTELGVLGAFWHVSPTTNTLPTWRYALSRSTPQNLKLLRTAISFSVQTTFSATWPLKTKTETDQTYYSLFYPAGTKLWIFWVDFIWY